MRARHVAARAERQVARRVRRRGPCALSALLVLVGSLAGDRAAAANGSVMGTVRAYDGAAGVGGVVMALSGSGQASITTGGDGGYAFADPGSGNWRLTAAKNGGLAAAVTAADVGCALRAAVGARALTPQQLLVTDVTGDGRVTALDAARILQLLAGRRAHLPIAEQCGSDWAFIPAPAAMPNQLVTAPQTVPACAPGAIAFSPLVPPVSGQDFLALAFGDCDAEARTPTPAAGTATRTPTRTFTPTPTPTSTPTPPARDWRVWPFDRTSPWNYPIGSAAQYAAVPALAQLPIGINYDDRWTSAVIVASAADPVATARFTLNWGPTSSWAFLSGGGLTCRNPANVESSLLAAAAGTWPPSDGNYYSTTVVTSNGSQVLPTSYHRASQDWRGSFHLPDGACPSPDTDGLMAVVQPDGWVLDVYAAVVTSNRAVVSTMGSWIDARGDGTGWWNGRRASMLPSFAGLIRTGEIAGGRIPHALAALAPPRLLAHAYAWPAAAFDRDADYGGTLPMGALLAIPASVDITRLGLSPRGLILARAAQDYGIYLVDRGGDGLTLLAELGNSEIRWNKEGSYPPDWLDLQIIRDHLARVTNNSAATRGGGGTPRVPLAPNL
ncbi:hypothetical protein KF840_04085 [bacterium]|nr:hypothetical protein [bacterium]